MQNLRNVSTVFLKNSKVLTLSCIISVFMAVLLVVTMYNFSFNGKSAYESGLRADFGDADIIVTNLNYEFFEHNLITEIKSLKEIDHIAQGRYANLDVQGNNVYTVGVTDNKLNRSRYKYQTNIKKDSVIINNNLADCMGLKVNDKLKIQGKAFRVSEVMKDNTGSALSITMMIMSQEVLNQILGDSNNANYLLIDLKEGVNAASVADKIKGLNTRLQITVVETETLFKDNLNSFSAFVKFLSLIIVVVAGLFVSSVFQNFLYKYNHDMAVVRAVGGTSKQVMKIFLLMSTKICITGCILGLLCSAILNKWVLNAINVNMHLIPGAITYYYIESIFITLLIFLILLFVLFLFLVRSFKIAPINAIKQTKAGKARKRRREKKNVSKGSFLRRCFGKEVYLGIKLLVPKMKENMFITLTIVMIFMISFVGGSIKEVIKNNNMNYIKGDYLTDMVVTTSSNLTYSESKEIYSTLSGELSKEVSMVLTDNYTDVFWKNTSNHINYLVADLINMQKQGIIKTNETNFGDKIILSQKYAKKLGLNVGDVLDINTPQQTIATKKGSVHNENIPITKKQLTVSAIVDNNIMKYRDAYIDLTNEDFIDKNFQGLECFYISGSSNKTETLLLNLKTKFPQIKWSNYGEVMKTTSDSIEQRFMLFQCVIYILILVSGIGWYNAMRNIIISRKKEYSILRMQGVSIKKVRKIINTQIFLYLVCGISMGIILGELVLVLLMWRETGSIVITENIQSIIILVLYMLGLAVLLSPVVKKVSEGHGFWSWEQ